MTRSHGMSKSRFYKIWIDMKDRCSKRRGNSEYYYDKGIRVCDSWQHFENFLKDMGETYKDDLSLDRIDSNGNYHPENCRWVTLVDQSYNRKIFRNNKTGKTGVCFREGRNKPWIARIYVDNELTNIGSFKTFEEAVAAREKAELEIYGYVKE